MTVPIVVPQLGESVVEARIARWHKQAGDVVAAGEALVELETEKIDLEVSADRAGVLGALKYQEGADVKVGDTITHVDNPCVQAITGFEDVKPMVFAGIYPVGDLRSCCRDRRMMLRDHRGGRDVAMARERPEPVALVARDGCLVTEAGERRVRVRMTVSAIRAR